MPTKRTKAKRVANAWPRLAPGELAIKHAGPGMPQLRFVGSPSGAHRVYLRHLRSDGRYDDLPLGGFNSKKEMEEIANPLIARWRAGQRDLREVREAERAAEEAARRATAEAEAEEAARRTGTLARLLALYVEDLRRAGKPSASHVESMLTRHVLGKPIAAMPAADVRREDVTALIHELVADGKLRTAAMVRSILKAAYRRAIEAPGDPTASPELRALRINADPTAGVRTVRGAIKARDRALSAQELRRFVTFVEAQPEPARSLLLAHLWLGGQRAEMLARAKVEDWDREAGTLTMLDPKGRREQPRRHTIPVIGAAAEALASLNRGLGPWLFTADGGATPCAYDGLAHRLSTVVERMQQFNAIASAFTPGDVRRTVETRLAALGVPTEVRARLQSHGLGGIQERHYVRHAYLDEMREALESLHRLATGSGTVIAMPTARRA